VNRYEIAIVVTDVLEPSVTREAVLTVGDGSSHEDEWMLFARIMGMIEEVRGELKPAS